MSLVRLIWEDGLKVGRLVSVTFEVEEFEEADILKRISLDMSQGL